VNEEKNFEKSKDINFYDNYFNKSSYDVFRYDVGSFCTRKYVLKHIKHKSGTVLEIGVGLSSLLEDLQNFDCFGVDISPETIKQAQDIFSSKKLKANFSTANAENLPFNDNTFDVIVSVHTLEHIEHDDIVIQECARVLKPGGELLFFVPGRVDGLATEEEWAKWGHYRMYNKDHFENLASLANPVLILTDLKYPHKVHNLIWNKCKNVFRWVNYPVKKIFLRDNKTYELRPTYQNFFLPTVSGILDFCDSFVLKKQKNFCGVAFNVFARFEKL
jgi:ubiquinone/menaquinone biosynthesis C-methylase UbiE